MTKTTWVHPGLKALVDKVMRIAMAPLVAVGALLVTGLVTGWVFYPEACPAWYESAFLCLITLMAFCAVWVLGVSMANDVLLRARGKAKS